MFVTLKPGVAFEPGRGSFVVNEVSYTSTRGRRGSPRRSRRSARFARRGDGSTVWRRIGRASWAYTTPLTGDPLVGADVVHVETGTFATTTSTGTVSLAFLPEGTSTIKIRKAGYADFTMEVSISPRDTIPLTLIISKPQS